jgi:hypothetical protein
MTKARRRYKLEDEDTATSEDFDNMAGGIHGMHGWRSLAVMV